jgi:uncharacterized protein YajQ (UPF0234 family)
MKTRCIWCGNSFDKEEIIDWNIDKEEIEEAVEMILKINKERYWFKNSQGIYKHK